MFRLTSCSLSVLIVGLIFSTSLRAEEREWVDLIPENNLDNWSTRGNWNINDDKVVSLIPREGESGWSCWDHYLWLNEEYAEFEFEFDCRVQENSNSGFYFHVADKDNPVSTGLEVQIFASGDKPEGTPLTDHDAGGLMPGKPPTTNGANPTGQWDHYHIRCQGNDLVVSLNGEVVNEMKLDDPRLAGRPEKGAIGFQDHSLPLSLRNMRVREL